MDHSRFDGLTRSRGVAASRRGLGRALAGGGFGALFGRAFGALDADAKQKRDKKNKKSKSKTAVRTVRRSVTQTFASTAPIVIPNGSAGTPANLYPSTIEVNGFTNGTITDVNLILNDFTHTYPQDVDILLSKSDGRRALIMSDVGSNANVAAIALTLDDEAAAEMPNGQLSSGIFRPTNLTGAGDTFDAPAPAPDGNVALSIFDGADPNGTWQLWVMANEFGLSGDFGGGWALQITAEVDVQAKRPIQAKNKKHKKKGKGRR